jgi:D-alanine-D-alanine ligase
MKIGLTYDLKEDYLKLGYDEQQVAEFDCPETIADIEGVLRRLGHTTDRIGRVGSLIKRLTRGDCWDLVFNIAEGLSSTGIAREAQVPMLLDLHGIPYTFSDPLVCALTLHKGATKRLVRDLGILTPDFAVVERTSDIAKVDLPFPLFCKPVAEGSSKGVFGNSKVRSREELAAVCTSLLERFRQPVLVETFLPGREFTVGIIGTGERARAVAAMEVHILRGGDEGVYSFGNKENWRQVMNYTLADDALAREAKHLAVAAWRGLGCRDGGRIDCRADASGKINFIEVNVLPGLSPVYSDLPILSKMAGLDFEELIGAIVESAMERIPAAPAIVEPKPRRRLPAKKAAKKVSRKPARRKVRR